MMNVGCGLQVMSQMARSWRGHKRKCVLMLKNASLIIVPSKAYDEEHKPVSLRPLASAVSAAVEMAMKNKLWRFSHTASDVTCNLSLCSLLGYGV
jgi:hypothetical protein